MNRVAVIILNWNGKHFLEKFLPSVITNTPADLADIIVADNGSTDDSIAFLSQHYPSIQIIPFDKNYGFTTGYNKAIAGISHKYTVLLNSDVETPPNWLLPLFEAMEKDSSVGACMPKMIAEHDKYTFEYAGAAGGFLDRFGYPFCRGRILKEVEADNKQYDSSMPIFWASGACFMVRTELYKSLGGLDDDFFAHMEEIDLCWRIQHKGYKIMIYPQSFVYHVGGGTLPNDNPHKLYLNFRNSLLMLEKNLPKKDLIGSIFVRMILDGAAGMAFLASGKFSFFNAVLKAHIDFYKMRSKFKQKRENIGNAAPLGFYRKSIVFSYFLNKKKRFSSLNSNDFM